MASAKPVIVLVHGAWQTAAQWQPVAKALTNKGFNVLQPQNATCGTDDDAICGKTYQDDVAIIHSTIEPHLEAGKEIVLVCHSYGGIPASAAAEGYQIHERQARGLPGGIKHIVYVAAFAFPAKGLSLLMALGGEFAPFMNNTGNVVVLGEGARDALYNDTEPRLTDQILGAGYHQSTASLTTPQTFAAADVGVAKTYVLAEDDHALPPDAQEGMIKALENVRVVRVQAGHCVHLNTNIRSKLVEAIEFVASA